MVELGPRENQRSVMDRILSRFSYQLFPKPVDSTPQHFNNSKTSCRPESVIEAEFDNDGIFSSESTPRPSSIATTSCPAPPDLSLALLSREFDIGPHNIDIVHPYSSHRLVLKEGSKIRAYENPECRGHLMAPIDICPRRLVDTHTLALVEFHERDTIPPYAILSHRWIKRKEVVYRRFKRHDRWTKLRSGYRKIQAACRQACQDGIRYIWIDTCCIKQGNHDDVAMNITSMYGYYQNAEVCYVYLVDVGRKRTMFDGRFWWQLGSEWFQRGWTLQELLAPRTVIFLNKRWQRIGDKYDLRDDIQRQTTIPSAVLSGEQSVQDVDVLTRMSWAMDRETTKEQDEAYCLQGLLGVSVEPDYDESYYASFNRLGKALFDARPELKQKLGINDDLFTNPNDYSFVFLLYGRSEDSRYKIHRTPRGFVGASGG
ncbi:hypothetical protein VKT23_009188 [Stygiomarasmius scandens]|uniref:Heterokaryon incompatibility domain-containing protein n=1 Tax=Marasmiellus scandens TaxID=2682957 RepID=A0ABR1JFJ3_9AGAR